MADAQQTRFVSDTLFLNPGDTITLDQTFLVPYSETIFRNETLVPSQEYWLDPSKGRLHIRGLTGPEAFVIRYRYFTRKPKEEIAIRRFEVTRDSLENREYVDVFYYPKDRNEDPFLESGSGIRKSGSLSRGLTVGNNQGLAVNSGLRLQLEGDLGGGLKIVGAITDENIPIQPDGTTQQISDFDKIFIKLMKGPYEVTIGDFEVEHKGTYFANLYRNVQGLKIGMKTDKTRASLSGAVAKGKFFTNQIDGIEGVAGPYRLTGRNGERFFTVLAGSEVVYLNGKRMVRGENNDYIINYNTAEIFFTYKHVITSITRIVVDFEYTDRYYNRSLIFADADQKLFNDKLEIHFSYGRDADNASAPFDNDVAFANARDTLSKVGDNTALAVTSGILETNQTDENALYIRRDTLLAGTLYERYVYEPASDSSIYQVAFSNVGGNNGFYIRSASSQNSNVFEWVGPDTLTGIPRGNYAPVRAWVLPRLLQVADARITFKLSDHISVYSETAISDEDQNRLSPLDDEDNIGIANRTGLVLNDLNITDSLRLSVDVSHQYVAQRYVNLDRVYKAEYNRVWDIDNLNQRTNEQIVMARTKWDYKRNLQLETETGWRNTGVGKQAIRQVYTLRSTMPKFLQGEYSFTQIRTRNDSLFRSTRWNRHNGDVFARMGVFKPGVELWIEDRNEQREDSLGIGSFSFVDLKPYFRTENAKSLHLDLSVNYRYEKEFFRGRERDKARAWTYFAKFLYKPIPQFNLQSTTAYRVFDVLDSTFQEKNLESTRILNTNLQSTYASKNRLFYTNFLYEVSSERVAQKEIRFIEVNPGQGQYVWLDSLFNNDGIQQQEEFKLAVNPLTANFIRVVFPTQELFPTTKASFTGTLRIKFKEVIEKSKQPFKQILRNFRSNTNFRVSQNKTRNNSLGSYLIDFTNIFADTTLLDANYNFRQDFTFFQNSPVGDLRFTYLSTRSKLFLVTGDEFREFGYWAAAQRLNIGKNKSIEAETRLGNKLTRAEQFNTRNYKIDFFQTKPTLNFQFNRKLRLSMGYEYGFRKNTNDSLRIDARAFIHKGVVEAKWNIKT